MYLAPVSSLMVRFWPKRCPSTLKYTAPSLGWMRSDTLIFTRLGMSPMARGGGGLSSSLPPPQQGRAERGGEGEEEEEGGGRGGAAGAQPAQPFPKAAHDGFSLPFPSNHGAASGSRVSSSPLSLRVPPVLPCPPVPPCPPCPRSQPVAAAPARPVQHRGPGQRPRARTSPAPSLPPRPTPLFSQGKPHHKGGVRPAWQFFSPLPMAATIPPRICARPALIQLYAAPDCVYSSRRLRHPFHSSAKNIYIFFLFHICSIYC